MVNKMKYEDLPEKFRLKFNDSTGPLWFNGFSGQDSWTRHQYDAKTWGTNTDCRYVGKGSPVWAMIEKGVLEVVEKRWRVFMKTSDDIRYLTESFGDYFWTCNPDLSKSFATFEDVRKIIPAVKSGKHIDWWTIYAEEFEVKK